MKSTSSKLYVDVDGLLRCGSPDRETSIIEGVAIQMTLDKEDNILFDVIFVNKTGVRCHGYLFSCETQFYQKMEYKKMN